MKIVVQLLLPGHPTRRLGFRWTVAGDGVPELAGKQWSGRQLSSVEAWAKVLAVRHACPAVLVGHGYESKLFIPTPEAVAELGRQPAPTPEDLGIHAGVPTEEGASVCTETGTGDRLAPPPGGAAIPGPELAGGGAC